MDSIKLEQLITDNMKSIFGFALTRLGNATEAEYLASDIIYKIIMSAQNLKDEERFYGFMWKIAENTYADYLRKKSVKIRHTTELDKNIVDEDESVLDEIAQKEELNLLRRELSLLSKQYRDSTVLYYMENLSCSEIAEKLKISTEMVKYYLFRARKIIREGLNMERLLGEKSYKPMGFEIDYWGLAKFNPNEYESFRKRKIKGNILLAAYYSPMTIQEISIELGVALPYLEDEIKLLVEQEHLVCNNGRYLTNIPIFTDECTKTINDKLEKLTNSTAKKFIDVSDDFFTQFSYKFANKNLSRWQKVLMCMHFTLMQTENTIKNQYSQATESSMGVVWGRSFESSVQNELPQGIQGIYNGVPSSDKRGSVIAMNFRQTLNAQHFDCSITDPVVCTAVDCYEYLPTDWQDRLDKLGYADNGKANFTVWEHKEYNELKKILNECITLVSELNYKTSEIAANITADLAPAHIRKTAEYVGALVYRFNSIDNFINTLLKMNWLKAVDNKEKPAICVVKN